MNNYTLLDLSVWELPVQEELLVLRRKVNRLPIDEVLSRYGVKMERRRGDMIDALCPFHLDHHLGSFKINVTKNSCFCFACQNGGGVVKSVSKILEKDETETILQIAMDFDLISETIFNHLSSSGEKYVRTKASDYRRESEPKKESLSEDTVRLRSVIYETVKEVYGLDNMDRAYLLHRGVPSDRIDLDYFTFPGKDLFDQILYRVCDKTGLNRATVGNTMIHTPGFIGTKEKRNGKEVTVPFMMVPVGIGILIRNAKGQVVAIQIRSKEIHPACRYTYFSYKAYGNDAFFGGGSVETPVDVIYPKEWNKRFAVTEGKFKAEQLALKGYVALSVQGVYNFKDVPDVISSAQKRLGQVNSALVDIFYDADFITNPNVCKARDELADLLLKNGCTVRVAIWDVKFGKGIDDLLLREGHHPGRFVPAKTAGEAFEKSFDLALQKFGLNRNSPISKITEEERKGIVNEFTKQMKRFFGI